MTMDRSQFRRAFTMIELLVVMAIIVILISIAVPAARSLSKNNDENQATNLVRSMISNARAIAISQHRAAGVVFFEETTRFSRPANSGQTAMQIFVEDFDQLRYPPHPAGLTFYMYYSTGRTYLPGGVRVA